MPGDWKEVRSLLLRRVAYFVSHCHKKIPVSNAKSGNYCQPRCDEVLFHLPRGEAKFIFSKATTEVQFASPTAGTLQVIIIPTNKLMITEKSPEIESVGTLDSVLNAVSPAITGRCARE